MNSLSSLDLQKNILDELYSLSDNELKRIFPEYEYLDDIVEKCSLKEISDRIEKYTSSITLEGLEKKKTARIAQLTGAPEEEVVRAAERLRRLSPRPGEGFEDSAETVYLYPDVLVLEEEGKQE